ncbi:glutathione S-transferase family protein [Arenimonas fontis]|uniref:Glutathione S-transferase family protein n=1 Tax=Arenimonas fontis TaxID=2608255 RepID=A0A5B2ZCC8_9GAMM|nr:glutathione S-transferase family protein [Arenimonas fontis]KAA2285729.1 glutathione S-transferase family protein [Arenimonas fontis]
MNLTLYASPMSSATPVVHALTELEVDCEIVILDLKAGEQKRPDYLAINPHGVVPTLVVDGTPLFESAAILQWLGEHYGVQRGLWPAAGTPARLEALSWSTWAYVSYGMLVNALNFAQSPNVDARLHHAPLAEEIRRRLARALDPLEARLAAQAWLLGERYSLLDLIVGSVLTHGTYCGASVQRHPRVADWLGRFAQRPVLARTWA